MVCLSHRCVHTTRDLLRELLRETAQSVAVVTALLPADPVRRPSSSTPTGYHGATLSSFTSVALDPLPLVAFSLRIPSRMASALNAHVVSSPTPSPHLIINILSAAQPHLADHFARPHLYPHPFADPSVPWTLSSEGIPILSGALGALSCSLAGPSLPLTRLGVHACDAFEGDSARVKGEDGEGDVAGSEREQQQVSAETGLPSELFIARVVRVERVPGDRAELNALPLIYHQRRYTTVRDA